MSPYTTNKTIKAIVFDFGGVIELFEGGSMPQRLSKLLNIPLEEFRKVYFEYNHLSNVHNLPFGEMLLKVVSVFDKSEKMKAAAEAIIEDDSKKRKINAELVALFPALRELGFRVAIFSNATSELRAKLKEKGLLETVDEVFISGEIGFQKPHKEAFHVVFEKLHVRPEEVIFIDDAMKSLEKSAEIEYTPILFKNNQQLLEDLKKLGIFLN